MRWREIRETRDMNANGCIDDLAIQGKCNNHHNDDQDNDQNKMTKK